RSVGALVAQRIPEFDLGDGRIAIHGAPTTRLHKSIRSGSSDQRARYASESDGSARLIMKALPPYSLPRAASVGNRAPGVLRRSERRRLSSASDDEVGGTMGAMREQLTKLAGLGGRGVSR